VVAVLEPCRASKGSTGWGETLFGDEAPLHHRDRRRPAGDGPSTALAQYSRDYLQPVPGMPGQYRDRRSRERFGGPVRQQPGTGRYRMKGNRGTMLRCRPSPYGFDACQ